MENINNLKDFRIILEKEVSNFQNSFPNNNRNIDQISALINDIKADERNIIKLNIDEITRLLKIFLDPNEVNRITEQLKIIKVVLIGIYEKKLNLKLENDQISQIIDFIKLIYARKESLIEQDKLNKIKFLNSNLECQEIIKILGIISSKEPNDFIEDVDLITKLMNKYKLDLDSQNKILIDTIKYNNLVAKKEPTKVETTNEKSEPVIEKETSKVVYSSENIITLLKHYGYKFEDFNPQIAKEIAKIEDIKGIADLLSAIHQSEFSYLKETDSLLAVLLLYSNAKIFERINSIITKEGIDYDELIDLPSIFVSKEITDNKYNCKELQVLPGHENFVNNINLLKQNNFKISEVIEAQKTTLILPTEKLNKNLQLFNAYGLSSRTRKDKINGVTLSILALNDLGFSIDKYVEVGILNYVRENHSRIKMYKPDTFYRFYHANKINSPIFYEEGNRTNTVLPHFFDNNGFNVDAQTIKKKYDIVDFSNEYLKKYEPIINEVINNFKVSDLDDTLLTNLRPYQQGSHLYNFNGKLISKYKVARIFNKGIEAKNIDLDSLLTFAITYNSIINTEELSYIQNVIKHEKNGKAK